ncbi:MAG: bifunctional (p)ppGpp synthetase/guanosine-3',5'-bis(diphosphate) 3'-pyrophosphohydrolase [Clostridia bacterium]|nr:bifunctional (p)ppGpp synthetase/guanosine-3',5'-bis(diphosphate) 3'-pyrophosphohydrolase [Clostridia bacterium]
MKIENKKFDEAIVFATKMHSGQLRKGTDIPYIVHPLEVMGILCSMKADENLMIAGVLHDIVEDTEATLDDIRKSFGEDVTMLVASNSEDKSKTWQERKSHTITELEKADKRVKMLIMADKLSNLRSIARDYKDIGDKLLERFNAPKEKQAWYYGGVQDALYDMQFCKECEGAYWEFVGLYKDVFVKYLYDARNEIIYQLCDDGTAFRMKKGSPAWESLENYIPKAIAEEIVKDENHQFFSASHVFDNTVMLSRWEAEHMEDEWNMNYWGKVNRDGKDGKYKSC